MNWGKGITVGIVLFMLFILSFVFRAFKHDADLVVDDYYEQEANFEKNRESKNNYDQLGSSIEVIKEENGICFYFPDDVQTTSPGSIKFYRPDSKSMDRSFELEIDTEHRQCLAYDNFFEGYYEITVAWNSNSKDYIFKDDIQF